MVTTEKMCKNCGFYDPPTDRGYCGYRRTYIGRQGADYLTCAAFEEKEEPKKRCCQECDHGYSRTRGVTWYCSVLEREVSGVSGIYHKNLLASDLPCNQFEER